METSTKDSNLPATDNLVGVRLVHEPSFFQINSVRLQQFQRHVQVQVSHGRVIIDFPKDGFLRQKSVLVYRRLVLPDFLENVNYLLFAINHNVHRRNIEVFNYHLEQKLLPFLASNHFGDTSLVTIGVVNDFRTQKETCKFTGARDGRSSWYLREGNLPQRPRQ